MVSIIVPLYNQERYLKACIKSLQHQTYKNIEIIIVNDGSTDNSPSIAKELASKDSRIKLINKENEGTSYARRDGYLASKGEYVAFMDDDDLMPKDSLEMMVNEIEEKGVDLLWGAVVRKMGFIYKRSKPDENSFPSGRIVRQPELYDVYYKGFFGINCIPVNIWGRLYRRSLIDHAYQNTELFSSKMPCMAGDEYFNLKVFPYINSAYEIDKVVYYYRSGGTVDNYNRFFPEVFYLSDVRLMILDESSYNKAYRSLFIEYVNCFYYHAEQLIKYGKGDRNGVIEFFKNELSQRKDFVKRMAEYFAANNIQKEGAQYMIDNDYEQMYSHSLKLVKRHFGGLKPKLKRLALTSINYINNIHI